MTTLPATRIDKPVVGRFYWLSTSRSAPSSIWIQSTGIRTFSFPAFLAWMNSQAVLRGLKPCMIGIVLATGVCMVLHNCLPKATPDLRNIVVTAVLAFIFYGSGFVFKKRISPVLLIIVSACIGIVAL